MAREWKPGDVAMIDGQVFVRVAEAECFASGGAHQRGDHWHGGVIEYRGTLADKKARPLVVINPEDNEAVQHLANLFGTQPDCLANYGFDAMRAALREFANPTPPKPEEPTGLGAVVEDAAGVRYVQVEPLGGVWRNALTAAAFTWDALPALRVLSEGVTA